MQIPPLLSKKAGWYLLFLFVLAGIMSYNDRVDKEDGGFIVIYLILAICSSALISIIMRLSTDKVSGGVSMLVMNYLMCLIMSVGYAGVGGLFPNDPALPATLGMGIVHGILYLAGFVLFQVNVKQNGVVLPAIFMKLGLLVPMAASVCFFGEIPNLIQIIGFVIAVAAIILINFEKEQGIVRSRAGLILLLLVGGTADVMSKVFEELGNTAFSNQFLVYTFLTAFVLCACLVIYKKEHIGKNEMIYGLLIGIPNFFSAKFLLKALESVAAVIAYPTYSVATILTVTVAGVLFFKEKLGKRQWLAVGIILVALVLLNL